MIEQEWVIAAIHFNGLSTINILIKILFFLSIPDLLKAECHRQVQKQVWKLLTTQYKCFTQVYVCGYFLTYFSCDTCSGKAGLQFVFFSLRGFRAACFLKSE